MSTELAPSDTPRPRRAARRVPLVFDNSSKRTASGGVTPFCRGSLAERLGGISLGIRRGSRDVRSTEQSEEPTARKGTANVLNLLRFRAMPPSSTSASRPH